MMLMIGASIWAVLLVSHTTALQATASFCDAPSYKRIFDENFSGDALDPSRWNVVSADINPGGMCRSAACRPENVAVHGGHLILTSRREAYEGHNYTTGAVTSLGKAEWWPSNGTFRACVSAILPGVVGRAQGVWPAHWMMPNTPGYLTKWCDPDLGEMDIMEMIDGQGMTYSTYHWQTTYPQKPCDYPVGHQSTHGTAQLGESWNETFHEFAVERGENHLLFAVDNTVIVNISTHTKPLTPMFWNAPWYMILNTAVGGSWPGEPTSDTAFPIHHKIDFVRVSRLV